MVLAWLSLGGSVCMSSCHIRDSVLHEKPSQGPVIPCQLPNLDNGIIHTPCTSCCLQVSSVETPWSFCVTRRDGVNMDVADAALDMPRCLPLLVASTAFSSLPRHAPSSDTTGYMSVTGVHKQRSTKRSPNKVRRLGARSGRHESALLLL